MKPFEVDFSIESNFETGALDVELTGADGKLRIAFAIDPDDARRFGAALIFQATSDAHEHAQLAAAVIAAFPPRTR